MSIKIITDSTADLLADTLNKVQVVPLTLRFGKDEYIDKVTIDNNTFYNKLIESDILPTTSQATPNDFEKVFKTIDPKDQAICISLMLSHTIGVFLKQLFLLVRHGGFELFFVPANQLQ